MRKILILICAVLGLYAGFGDEFYELSHKERKTAFIKYLQPIIVKENQAIVSQRDFCISFINQAWQKGFIGLDNEQYLQFLKIATSYKIRKIFNVYEFYKKIAEIPVSLALAQAALESGWGSSRFTKEANNIFGHWTWDGSGLVPLDRQSGKRHTIRIFNSLHESVQMYALNLNSNDAYDDFRKLRFEMALRGENLTGLRAAKTMQNYSELGNEYIKMIENLIKQFNLSEFDR